MSIIKAGAGRGGRAGCASVCLQRCRAGGSTTNHSKKTGGRPVEVPSTRSRYAHRTTPKKKKIVLATVELVEAGQTATLGKLYSFDIPFLAPAASGSVSPAPRPAGRSAATDWCSMTSW